MFEFQQWEGFTGTAWKKAIDVREFIQNNYTPYEGDSSFLCPATKRTDDLMEKLNALLDKERENGGLLEIENETVSSLTGYGSRFLSLCLWL